MFHKYINLGTCVLFIASSARWTYLTNADFLNAIKLIYIKCVGVSFVPFISKNELDNDNDKYIVI